MTNRHRLRARTRMAAILALMGAVGACSEEPVPDAGRYVRQDRVDTVPLFFAPGSAALTATDAARLRAVRAGLPSDAALSLAVADDPAQARAWEVGAVLGRVVAVDPVQLAAPPGLATLAITSRPVVNTDCLGPGQPTARGSWPGDDALRARSLPPGCAVATALQRMTVDQEDLLRGRPLPPGAAFPVARAIERYYDRWRVGGAAADNTLPTPGLGAGNVTPVSVTPAAAAAGAPGGADGDLLQGPLQPTSTVAPAASPAQ